jgi:hypothetical protein
MVTMITIRNGMMATITTRELQLQMYTIFHGKANVKIKE